MNRWKTGLALMVAGLALGRPALAKDMCFQVDEGSYAGRKVLVRDIRSTPRQHGLVYGYLRLYTPGQGQVDAFPLTGQAMVSSTGNLLVSLLILKGGIEPNAKATAYWNPAQPESISFACNAGGDGRVGVLDACPNSFVISEYADSHVIPCQDVDPLP